jgi:hypothetical protein
MGSPKHFSGPSTGQALYREFVKFCCFPQHTMINVSVTNKSTLVNIFHQGFFSFLIEANSKHTELKKTSDEITQDIGPAASILAAHCYNLDATWLVMAFHFSSTQSCSTILDEKRLQSSRCDPS